MNENDFDHNDDICDAWWCGWSEWSKKKIKTLPIRNQQTPTIAIQSTLVHWSCNLQTTKPWTELCSVVLYYSFSAAIIHCSALLQCKSWLVISQALELSGKKKSAVLLHLPSTPTSSSWSSWSSWSAWGWWWFSWSSWPAHCRWSWSLLLSLILPWSSSRSWSIEKEGDHFRYLKQLIDHWRWWSLSLF